jgi:RNA polymerase sigma factor (sigma-70 family)
METVGRIRGRFEAYKDLAMEIDCQIDRLERLEASAMSPSGPNLDGMPMPKGAPGDRVGRSVALLDALRAEVAEMVQQERELRRELEGYLVGLCAIEKTVIRVVYLDRASVEEAADLLGVSESSIKNYKKRAFAKMEGDICYESEGVQAGTDCGSAGTGRPAE